MITGGTLDGGPASDELRVPEGAHPKGWRYSDASHPATKSPCGIIPAERVEGRDNLKTLVVKSLGAIAILPGQDQPLTHLAEGRISIHRRKSDDRLVLILRNGGLPLLSKPVAFWGRDYSQPHGGCWKPALEIEQNIQQFLTQIKKGF